MDRAYCLSFILRELPTRAFMPGILPQATSSCSRSRRPRTGSGSWPFRQSFIPIQCHGRITGHSYRARSYADTEMIGADKIDRVSKV